MGRHHHAATPIRRALAGRAWLAWVWAAGAGLCGLGHAAAASADPACMGAAQASAQAQGVPATLMLSIAQVESAGQPWTVNADGAGHSFATKQEAIDYVQSAQAAGARFIDVGCFQIDLHYHPDAFNDLSTAFDPAANAAYAARFLTTLRGWDSGWDNAVAAYHSGDPALGRAYRDLVFGTHSNEGARTWFAGMRVETPGRAPGGQASMPRLPGLPVVYEP